MGVVLREQRDRVQRAPRVRRSCRVTAVRVDRVVAGAVLVDAVVDAVVDAA